MAQRITYSLLTRGEKDKPKEMYREMKRQVRTMRRKNNTGSEEPVVDVSEMKSWDARLPNMHQLLLSENFECQRYAQEVFEILGDDDPAPLRSLEYWIDQRFPNTESYVTNPKQLCKIVSALSINIYLLLRTILDDEEYLQTITEQSDHVDFFDKLVLMKGGKDWKLRLHIFTPDSLSTVQEGLHSHRNHFVSSCLYGKIQQGIWEPCAENDTESVAFKQYEYDPVVSEDGKVFNLKKHDDDIYMRESRIESTYAGQKYYMHPSVIHKVTMVSGHTVTLVLNSRNVMKKSCFCSEDDWYDPQHLRPKFTLEQTRAVINKVVGLIK